MRRKCIILSFLCSTGSSLAFADQNDLTLQNGPPAAKQPPADILDIYPPIQLPDPVNWPVILFTLAAVLLLAALLWFLRQRKNKRAVPPVIPPHLTALADLQLARQHIISGQSLLYAERVSEVLRGYVEKRFGIKSTRQTTTEFLTALSSTEGDGIEDLSEHKPSLANFLHQCDLAKYAHKTSARENMELMEETIRHFIEETKALEKN